MQSFTSNQAASFFREQFHVLLVAVLFLITFAVFVLNPNNELTIWLKDICQGFLYAFLALVGVRRVGSAIGTASTESGDVRVNMPPPAADPSKEDEGQGSTSVDDDSSTMPPPADPAKENNQNEKPISE